MKLVNKTGRELVIFVPGTESSVTLPADGPGAKWAPSPDAPAFARGETLVVDGLAIPVSAALSPSPAYPGSIEGLPAPEDGTVFAVAYPVEVAAWLSGRRDCVRMGPGRFRDGKQVGADGFARS